MSYYADEEVCPYCDAPKPQFVTIESEVWDLIVQEGRDFFDSPFRLLHTFDLQRFNEVTDYRLSIDFAKESVLPARGYADPSGLIEFQFSKEDL